MSRLLANGRAVGGALGDPRRMLGDVAEGGDEIGQIHGVDRLKRDREIDHDPGPRFRWACSSGS